MSGRTVALEDFCDACGERNPGQGQMGSDCPHCKREAELAAARHSCLWQRG